MEEKGYVVLPYEFSTDSEGFVGGFEAVNSDSEYMYALLFETEADASECMRAIPAMHSVFGAVRDGKWIYWGDEDAIEDFTKGF